MIKEFVHTRPSLGLGTEIAGLHISRPLHCDDTCELYLLDGDEKNRAIVLLYPIAGEQNETDLLSRLEQWWHLFPEGMVSYDNKETVRINDRIYLRIILRFDGLLLLEDPIDLSSLDDLSLRKLLKSTLELCTQAKIKDLSAQLCASLTVICRIGNEYQLLPVIAEPFSREAERRAITDLARLAYLLISGFDPMKGDGTTISLLSKWSKNIGKDTSQLLLRCLESEHDYVFEDLIRDIDRGLDRKRQERNVKSVGIPKDNKVGRSAFGLAKVAGMKRLKSLLEKEVVLPLRDPEPFREYGLSIPNGILLFGPPGCGKTYISRQLAEELGYFFFELIPSEVAGVYIHQTVLKIRDVFETAAEKAPAVVFIDEFEALVPPRSELGGHQQYKSEEVNELLVQIGSCAERNIFLIAATNEPQKIDVAVRRTGRLDKLIYVGPPDEEARIEMLQMYLADRPCVENLDITSLATALSGYSASDLKFIVDEAARLALLREKSPISLSLLEEAVEQVPPSISSEDELKYASFLQRGIG